MSQPLEAPLKSAGVNQEPGKGWERTRGQGQLLGGQGSRTSVALRQTPISLLQVPTSSTTSRTSSASHSQQESQLELSPQDLSGHVSPPTPPVLHTPPAPLNSSPPTPPEPQPQPQPLPLSQSRRSTKMHDNHDNWGHSTIRDRDRDRDPREARDARDVRDSRDSRDSPQRDYPRTPPLEWKPYSQRRPTYNSQDRDYMADVGRQREDDNEDEEAYWSSVRTLYEKSPGCSRPRPVSRARRPWHPGRPSAQPQSLRPSNISPLHAGGKSKGIPSPPSAALVVGVGGGGGDGVGSRGWKMEVGEGGSRPKLFPAS